MDCRFFDTLYSNSDIYRNYARATLYEYPASCDFPSAMAFLVHRSSSRKGTGISLAVPQSMTTNTTILFIDDDKNFRQVMTYSLREEGFDVLAAANGEEGLRQLADRRPEVIVCDLTMPVLDGMGFLQGLKETGLDIPVIVVTAYGSIESAVKAMRAGAYDYVTKPINVEALRHAIQRALDRNRLTEENRLLKERFAAESASAKLLGESPAMVKLRETLLKLAASSATVLLRGESGVGKELAARALHYDGPRAKSGRFVTVNCAAIPAELLESELFGHVKGAFTGAAADRAGKFEEADKGTLFLDEVGDMPLALQAKVLRALQEGELTRVGRNVSQKVDVRVVAATNQPLEERIREGQFRTDLFYRLNVVPVSLPPLRDRREDIPLLASRFLGEFTGRAARFADSALEQLTRHDWPGNVRELQNVLMRVAALHPGLVVLEAGHLEDALTNAIAPTEGLFGDAPLQIPPGGVVLDEIEARLIRAAWDQSGHNQSEGARLLGLHRQQFIYRLQKLELIPTPKGKEDKE